jgi:hypothetical protein
MGSGRANPLTLRKNRYKNKHYLVLNGQFWYQNSPFKEFTIKSHHVRDTKWTENIAACPVKCLCFLFNWDRSQQFIEKVKEKLGLQARDRKVNDAGDASFQREAQSTYGDDSANIDLVTENTFL